MWSSVWSTDKRQRLSFHEKTLFYCFCETTTENFPNFHVKRHNNKVVCPMPIIKSFFSLFTTVKLFIKRVWTGETRLTQKVRLEVDEKFISSRKSRKISTFLLATQFSFVKKNRNAQRLEICSRSTVCYDSIESCEVQTTAWFLTYQWTWTCKLNNAASIGIKCIVAWGVCKSDVYDRCFNKINYNYCFIIKGVQVRVLGTAGGKMC